MMPEQKLKLWREFWCLLRDTGWWEWRAIFASSCVCMLQKSFSAHSVAHVVSIAVSILLCELLFWTCVVRCLFHIENIFGSNRVWRYLQS